MAKTAVPLLLVAALCILATVSAAKETEGSASPAPSAARSRAKKVPPPSPSRKIETPPSATDGATVSGPTPYAASPSESIVLPPMPSPSIDSEALTPAFAVRPHSAAVPINNSAMWGFSVTVIAFMLAVMA